MPEILVKDDYGRAVGKVNTEMDGWREQVEKLNHLADDQSRKENLNSCAAEMPKTSYVNEVRREPVAYPTDNMIHEMCVYHPPNSPSQIQKFSNINFATESFMRAIRDNAPGCTDREQAFAMARMARMMANSAIANDGRF